MARVRGGDDDEPSDDLVPCEQGPLSHVKLPCNPTLTVASSESRLFCLQGSQVVLDFGPLLAGRSETRQVLPHPSRTHANLRPNNVSCTSSTRQTQASRSTSQRSAQWAAQRTKRHALLWRWRASRLSGCVAFCLSDSAHRAAKVPKDGNALSISLVAPPDRTGDVCAEFGLSTSTAEGQVGTTDQRRSISLVVIDCAQIDVTIALKASFTQLNVDFSAQALEFGVCVCRAKHSVVQALTRTSGSQSCHPDFGSVDTLRISNRTPMVMSLVADVIAIDAASRGRCFFKVRHRCVHCGCPHPRSALARVSHRGKRHRGHCSALRARRDVHGELLPSPRVVLHWPKSGTRRAPFITCCAWAWARAPSRC